MPFSAISEIQSASFSCTILTCPGSVQLQFKFWLNRICRSGKEDFFKFFIKIQGGHTRTRRNLAEPGGTQF